jgi:hypothetical protein
MTFYAVRDDAKAPTGSHGPVDQDTALYCPYQRTLDPTPEQELAAGWSNGPNLANHNARMVLRSLGLADTDADDGSVSLDSADLHGRLLTALTVGGTIADDGMSDISNRSAGGALMVSCGVRPGYFADVYERMLPVAEQALVWGVAVTLA